MYKIGLLKRRITKEGSSRVHCHVYEIAAFASSFRSVRRKHKKDIISFYSGRKKQESLNANCLEGKRGNMEDNRAPSLSLFLVVVLSTASFMT